MVVDKLKKILEILILILLLVFLNLYILGINFNKKSPGNVVIKLEGENNIKVPYNSVYMDPGIKVFIGNVLVNNKAYDLNIKNNVKIDQIGKYKVEYTVDLNGKKYYVTRNVQVTDDIEPELVILTSKVSKGRKDNNLRYYAYDNYDGIITDKVIIEETNTEYILKVTDSNNNTTEKRVEKSDTVNDYVLELEGTLIQYVALNEEFIDKGVKVKNLNSKELKVNYITESDVDTSKVGTYHVKYYINGVDSYQERIVKVFEKNNGKVMEDGERKVIYLTFDDGPGAYTEELLDILDKYNVKATFFVTGQFPKYVPLIGEEAKRGHKVAVHTKTHEWKIYRSFENYFKDFNDINDLIEQYTGSRSNIFRFPGGASNTISRGKSLGVMNYATSKMTELGYVYYDWNVDSEDAAGADSNRIYRNVTYGINSRNESVVLMHDIKRSTIEIIDKIIKYGLDNGYTFDVLSESTITVHHHVNN